ncbi:JmjC domain-containing protein [Streptomyces sp. ACT015]|uniref:JmjC domain-containing protein n=1 Tax=Streptomyces sp. ACT015 TaxID=3134807 RepID=UPI003D1753BA
MTAQILDRLVGDTVSFWSHWRASPGVFVAGGEAVSPFTLADIDAALASGFFREPYVEMWADGRRMPAGEFTTERAVGQGAQGGFVDAARIHALLGEGATMLLRRVDQWHAPTRELLRALARELRRAVEAFFFVTPAGQEGLPLHRDDADVLVVQVAGTKNWRVHEGPADGAWRAGRVRSDEPRPQELFQTVLRPGETLYIPRGFAHRATGEDGLSAHLSLTVREIGVADLSRSLKDRVLGAEGDDVAGAGPLPISDDALAAAATTLLDNARRRLAELTPDALVAHARQRRLDLMPATGPDLSLTGLAASLTATAGHGRERTPDGERPPDGEPRARAV